MKSSWITENDLDAARANVLLAQSLAAAHWDPKNVVLGDDVVAKATELVIPDGTQTWARDPHLTDMSPYQNGLFAKTTRLKRLVVGDVDFPTYYFAYLQVEEVEIPMSSLRHCMFQNSKVRRVVLKQSPPGRLPAERVQQVDFARFVFASCPRLREIIMEDGPLAVPTQFCINSAVRTVKLPPSVQYVSGAAFLDCKRLESINVPDGCVVSDNAFENCKSLREVDAELGEVRMAAFKNSGIRKARVNGAIGSYAFTGCKDLEKVEFGPRCKIRRYAFSDCPSLEKVYIPAGVESIGARAFEKCRTLCSIYVEDPRPILEMARDNSGTYTPFAQCVRVETACVAVPQQLDDLSDDDILAKLGLQARRARLFRIGSEDKTAAVVAELNKAGITTTAGVRTSVIQSITAIFPDEGMTPDDAEAVSKAVQAAGEGCQIVFMGENGDAVKTFSDLSQIKFVRFKFLNSGAKGSQPARLDEHGPDPDPAQRANALLAQTLAQTNGDPAPGVIPAEVFHDATELVFPDGIRLERFARFGEDRFCQTTPNLRKLVINDSGTVLPGGYFKNLQVKEITVPYEVITRSVNLFRGSTAKRVKITNGGGGNADFSFGQFMECMNLESVEIENGVSAVPDSCFYKCEKLKRVEIPDSVTVINKGAFSDCVSLLDAGLPPNVRTIGDVAYRGCDSLSEVSIPAGADVGSHAFCNCQNLERVFVDGKVGDNAFAECPNLRRVEFGPNARDIGGQAFANCKGLKTVSLPEGLERVRKEAFYGAGLVTAKVACGETCFTRDWPSSEPFRNCNDMQSVYVANDFEGDKYRLVRLFGLRSVQEKVSIVKEGDWSWAPGCALADAGIAPGFMADGKLMLVDFGEKGLDQGTADLLAGAIAKAGDDIGVVFIGTDNTVLKALSDLSDVKKLLIYPPKKDASKAV